MPFGVTLAPRQKERSGAATGGVGGRRSGDQWRGRKEEQRRHQRQRRCGFAAATEPSPSSPPSDSPLPPPGICHCRRHQAIPALPAFGFAAATAGFAAVARARIRILRRCHRAIPALPSFGFAATTAGFAAVARDRLRIRCRHRRICHCYRRPPHHQIRRGRRLSAPSSSSERARWAEEQSTIRGGGRVDRLRAVVWLRKEISKVSASRSSLTLCDKALLGS
uniref:Uncharacterized protein n=1 Tax=Oryza barthii TaxID=65489 RepID=A0A0D3FA65_9ORYZ